MILNNSFLNGIGFGNLDIGIVICIMLGVIFLLMIISIINMCSIHKLKKTYKKFMQGKNAKSLEQEVIGLFEDNKFIKNSIEKNRKDIRILYKNFESAFQKFGVVKYDAFNQMGGQLSFCIALLDENNNGFIINSVHSTEGCYTYTKEIKNGTCTISLGNEEKEALNIAIGADE